jgi:hypothetical protein
MKRFLLGCSTLLFSAAVLLTTSCNKDDGDNNPGTTGWMESPINNVVSEHRFYEQLENINDVDAKEMGYKFYSSRDGVITALGCMMPYSGNVQVTLWDYDTKKVIRTTQLFTDSANFVYKDVPSLNIEANKRYVISINTFADEATRRYYALTWSDSRNYLPFSQGHISIEKSLFKVSQNSVFPTVESANNIMYGIADFKINYQ